MACTEKNYWFQPTPKAGINDRFPAGPHPNGKTGKVGEGKTAKYLYKGTEWTGHTGFIGRKDWPQLVARARAAE